MSEPQITDLIKQLREAIAEGHSDWITTRHDNIAALLDRLDKAQRENERLREWEACAREWLDKTEWVQKEVQPKDLGRHRADIMRDEIERLRKELATTDEFLTAAAKDLDFWRADALRYRFIRDNPWPPDLVSVIQMQMNGKWDAAIDAARAAKQRDERREKWNLGRGQLMAVAAMRYCLGRSSYIVGDCADWLISIWPELSADTRAVIRKDIEEAFALEASDRALGYRYKALGDDCDRAQWGRVRALWASDEGSEG